MKSTYKGHRFPPEIISHAIWLYHRFTLSFRDVEEMFAERGISVSYEAIRYWCGRFGPIYARSLRRKQGRLGDIIDILVAKHRDFEASRSSALATCDRQASHVSGCTP